MFQKIIETEKGKAIYIESDQIIDDMYLAEKQNIKNLIISEYNNLYKIKNLDFLKDYPFIENITISAFNQIDYSAIHYLNNLRILNINLLISDKGEIDFNSFPKIEEVGIEWNKKRINFFETKSLKDIFISKYKNKDLEDFKELKNLTSLNIFQSSIENLNGIAYLQNLKFLKLGYNRKLSEINTIENNNLKEIKIENCKNISNLNFVRHLKNLVKLTVDDCGEINSLEPIKNVENLKELYFNGNTNILDGDLNILNSLKNFSFQDRKHYNLKYKNLLENNKNFR